MLRDNTETLACSVTKLYFRENGLSTVLCSVLATVKSGDFMFIKQIHMGKKKKARSQFVSNGWGLFH